MLPSHDTLEKHRRLKQRSRNKKRTRVSSIRGVLIDVNILCSPTSYRPIVFRFNTKTNGRFLERKTWNPLAYVADRLKKLRGSGQPYLVNVTIVLM